MTTDDASRKKKVRPPLLGCAFAIIAVVLGAVFVINTAPPGTFDTKSSLDSKVQPIAIGAVELAAAYSANEVAAQKTYGDQILDVTGVVSGIRLDLFNNPVVDLIGVNEFLPVQAKYDESYGDQLSALSKGDRVTLRCKSITSVLTTPMLSDCTSISDANIPAPKVLPAAPPAPISTAAIPTFSEATLYSDIRETLIKSGWQPTTLPNSDSCGEGDSRCQGYPEMESCSGTGRGYCLFVWRRGNRLIGIIAEGDAPQTFAGSRPCSSKEDC